jgi:hypothetical protein
MSIRGLELEVKLLCHTLTVGGVRRAEMADLATDDVFRHAPHISRHLHATRNTRRVIATC